MLAADFRLVARKDRPEVSSRAAVLFEFPPRSSGRANYLGITATLAFNAGFFPLTLLIKGDTTTPNRIMPSARRAHRYIDNPAPHERTAIIDSALY
jgi:hypothetical protein